jgi:hypothetical protein
MAAFVHDGILIPFQQPVELKVYSLFHFKLVGWPGRSSIIRGGRVVGCCRWLPLNMSTHGGQASRELVGPSGNAEGGCAQVHVTHGCSATQMLAPGLLVIQLESKGDGYNSSREAAQQANAAAQVVAEHRGGSMPRGAQQGAEEDGQELDRSESDTDLATVASKVVPFYAGDRPTVLRLPLPCSLARHFSSVLLEMGGVRLPAWATRRLTVRAGNRYSSAVTSICSWSSMKTAQMLPCSAVQVGEEWALVVRATWPPSQLGQLVSPPAISSCNVYECIPDPLHVSSNPVNMPCGSVSCRLPATYSAPVHAHGITNAQHIHRHFHNTNIWQTA